MSRPSASRGPAARLARSAGRRLRSAGHHLHRGGPLSVVLVVHGRGLFLDEALRSVLATGHPVGEVLVVGDPSDRIVRERLESTTFDERRVRHLRPSDRASWLDEAVRAARGDYVAFVDADDTVPAHTYQRLVAALRESGSDLAVGPRRHVRASKSRTDGWGEDVFARARVRETVDTFPEALVDVALTNKVYRLEWWRSSGLSVPSWTGAAPTVLAAYLAASAFDVVPSAVHEHHARGSSLPVEEQADFEPTTARERLCGLTKGAELVAGHSDELFDRWLVSVFEHHLPGMYIDAVGGGEEYHRALSAGVAELWSRLSPDAAPRISVHPRVSAWVAAHGGLTDLARMQELLADHPHGLPTRTVEAEAQLVLLPPLSTVPPEGLTRIEVVDRRMRARIDWLVRDGRHLVLRGAAFVEYDRVHQAPELELTDPAGGRYELLDVAPFEGAQLNVWAARAHEDHAGSGFVARFDASQADTPPGRWSVELRLGGRTRTLLVALDDPAAAPDASTLVIRDLGLVDDVVKLSVHGASAVSVRLKGPRASSRWSRVSAGRSSIEVEIPLRTVLFGDSVALPTDRYRIEVRGARDRPLAVRWADALLREPSDHAGERVRVSAEVGARGAALLAVGPPLPAQDRSPFGQQLLRSTVYAAPDAPLRGRTILLETFGGRSTGDNPGAIGRAMLERSRAEGLELDLAFVVHDLSVVVPPGTRAVVRRSRAWYEALASAGAYIGNAGAPYWFEKRPGQIHLQTWHGTPLKKIGEDRGPGDFSTWRHRRHIAAQAAGWDGLLSANPATSDIFRSAFRYPGRALEFGYPRNDVLLSARADGLRNRVRDALGLAERDHAVLYAPTWREYLGVRDAKPLYLDAEQVTRSLPDAVVLIRGHYNSTGQADVFVDHQRILDVTRYPDIADLYLAADALVTDYSSVMFDFALTDKPIVLLVPDLVQYRDIERGFYFDLEERAPGRLVETTAEVIDALAGSDQHSGARERFRREFSPFEDGAASARTVEYCLALMSELY